MKVSRPRKSHNGPGTPAALFPVSHLPPGPNLRYHSRAGGYINPQQPPDPAGRQGDSSDIAAQATMSIAMSESSPITSITFQCSRLIPYTPAEIAAAIADTSRWPEFTGYGPMPGILSAEYETRTPEMSGSRIRVHNSDGSSHVETIEVWQPPEQIVMRLHEFTPPLSRLADHFLESWRFTVGPDGTRTSRQLQLYPRSPATRPLLWLISLLLRRAIAAHLEQMARPTV